MTGIALWTPRLCLGQPRAAAAPCAGPWSPPSSSQNTRASASESTLRRHERTALPAEFGAFVDPFSLLLFCYSLWKERSKGGKLAHYVFPLSCFSLSFWKVLPLKWLFWTGSNWYYPWGIKENLLQQQILILSKGRPRSLSCPSPRRVVTCGFTGPTVKKIPFFSSSLQP